MPGSTGPLGLLALAGLLILRRRSLIASVALTGCATAPNTGDTIDASRGNIPELGPVCDYDGDGIIDEVRVFPYVSIEAPTGGRVEVALLNADGSERQVIDLVGDVPEAGFGSAIVCAGDMDGDGTDDLVLGSRVHGEFGAALVFRGGPAGPTTTPEVFLALDSPVGGSVYAADVNGDNLPDIVLQNGETSPVFSTFLGDGVSVHPTPTQLIWDGRLRYATVADVDGDGSDDLVVAEDGTGSVVTFAGGVDGFSATPTYTSTPIDNVFSLLAYRSKSGGRDTVLIGAPVAAVLRPETPLGVEMLSVPVASGREVEDLNNDGYVDLPGPRDVTYWGTAQGPSVLPMITDARLASDFDPARAVDVDGDGRADAVGDVPLRVVLSTGGIWTPPGQVMGTVGDADTDGVPDLVITRMEAGIWKWYVAEYAPTLTLNPVLGRSGQVDSVLGDLDGNGVAEVSLNRSVVAYNSPPTAPSSWVASPFGQYQGAGDVNGDGFDDLIASAGQEVGLWYGADAELAGVPDVRLAGISQPAGDANADGFDDLWLYESSRQRGSFRVSLFLGASAGISESPVDEMVFNDVPRQRVSLGGDRAVTRGETAGVIFGFDGTHITLASFAPAATQTVRDAVGIQLTDDGVPGVPTVFSRVARFVDADGDGSFLGTDCDDDDPSVVPRLAWWDADGDGAGDLSRPLMTCTSSDVVSENPFDCDEEDDTISPTAPERCNGVDDNCDGVVDNDPADPPIFYQDLDGDGVGGALSLGACVAPTPAWVRIGGDCDDSNASRAPGITETCNGVDDDCNGWVDDSVEGNESGFLDADGDGFGTTPITACSPDVPWLAEQGGDCGPDNPDQYPGATEVWYDGVDQSCDGNDTDQDGDGVPLGADCDDTNSAISPRIQEVWYDGVDQDCDANDTDQDADGVDEADDCDDQNPTAFPGAVEIWYDGVDQDCDGNDLDQDGDGLSVIEDCDDTDSDNVDVCDNAPGCTTLPTPSSGLSLLVLLAFRRRRKN